MNNSKIKKTTAYLCITALFTALNIVMSSFGVPVPGGHLYLNDVIICLAALILDPFSAFIVGGVGAFIGDLIFYPLPMFVSLVTHGVQAIVISVFANYLFKKKKLLGAILGVTFGAIIMIVGYSIGRAFIYSTPEYAIIKLPYQILQAGVGAVVGTLLCFKCKIKYAFNKVMQRHSN